MAIVVGTPTVGHFTSDLGSYTYTFNYTCPAGAKAIVFGLTLEVGSSTVTNQVTLSSVTWNGVAMSTAVVRDNGSSQRAEGIFYLLNPASGAHAFQFTATPTEDDMVRPTGSYLFAVDLTGTVGGLIGDTQTRAAASPSVTYTVQGTGGVVFDVFGANSTAIVGGSQTAIFDNQALDAVRGKGGASYQMHTGADITNSYTGSGAPLYAGAEFEDGSLFVPIITMI